VNILANEFDRETAEMFLKVKKDKDKDRYVYKKECSALTTLCGIKPGQTEASFEGWGLRAHDALLLADELAGSSVLKTDCALPVDSVLTSLDLHCNDIGSAGALAIAEALKSGRSVLTNLDLRLNKLDDNAKRTLTDAVRKGALGSSPLALMGGPKL